MEDKVVREFVERLTAGHRQLYAFIRSQVRNRDDAEELMQQTTVVLWEKYSTFRPEGDFVRWACGVARLEVLSHARNQRRLRFQLRQDLAEAIGRRLAEAAAETDTRLAFLNECIKELPLRDQELIRRHYHHEQSVKEIAAALEISESLVYKRLSHCRDLLYDCIQRRLTDSQRK